MTPQILDKLGEPVSWWILKPQTQTIEGQTLQLLAFIQSYFHTYTFHDWLLSFLLTSFVVAKQLLSSWTDWKDDRVVSSFILRHSNCSARFWRGKNNLKFKIPTYNTSFSGLCPHHVRILWKALLGLCQHQRLSSKKWRQQICAGYLANQTKSAKLENKQILTHSGSTFLSLFGLNFHMI